jgi:single-stranded-DNA-specific exonuclease
MRTYTQKERLEETKRNIFKKYTDTIAQLLYVRGICTEEEAENFLAPMYDEKIYDPFLITDMEKASNRLIHAIENKENICIFSDYDADGIPGAVVFHDFLKSIGHTHFFNYIPNRQEEGFGLSSKAIEECKEKKVTLLITIDCGVTDTQEVLLANQLGIDVIITDHHLPKEILPQAYAIVNPKLSPKYPDQMICGAAVAFKLIQAVLQKNRFGLKKGQEKWWLDMVGIATLSDMVPLVNENRIFAYFGLLVLHKSKRIGLQKLLKKIKINQAALTEDDIGFMVTPRINAASRMGYAYDAFRLLTTENEIEANSLTEHLEKINTERKSISAHLSKEVRKMVEGKYSPLFTNKVIVAGSPSWSPSLLGLVAGNIAESESKPVFLWGREGVTPSLKGSCRSVGGVSVTDILSRVSPEVLTDFGGHHQAGGFSVSYDTVHLLESEIEKAYEQETKEVLVPDIAVDFTLEAEFVNSQLLTEIERLAPFGIGNPKPLFLFPSSYVLDVSFFGKEKNHLKVLLEKKGKPLEAICFFVHPEIVKKIEKGNRINFVGNIERNFFGTNSVRIRIVDVVV